MNKPTYEITVTITTKQFNDLDNLAIHLDTPQDLIATIKNNQTTPKAKAIKYPIKFQFQNTGDLADIGVDYLEKHFTAISTIPNLTFNFANYLMDLIDEETNFLYEVNNIYYFVSLASN